MALEHEIAKAARIMSSRGVPAGEQVEIVRILVDAGVEKCLDEQEKYRQETDALLKKAYVGPGLVH